MKSGAALGLKGARELVKTKQRGRPELTDDTTPYIFQQHPTQYEAQDSIDSAFNKRMEELNEREEYLKNEQSTLRNQQQDIKHQQASILSQQIKLNKLYEVLEQKTHEMTMKKAQLNDVEKKLQDKESILAQCQTELRKKEQMLANQINDTPNATMIEAREMANTHREQALAIWSERLGTQEKQLITMERLFEAKQQEIIVENEKQSKRYLCAVRQLEWDKEKAHNLMKQTQENILLQHEDLLSNLVAKELKLKVKESELSECQNTLSTKSQLLFEREMALRNQEVGLNERQCYLENLEAQLIQSQASITERERLLRIKEKRLDVFAKDVEAQHQFNLQKRKELDNRESVAK